MQPDPSPGNKSWKNTEKRVRKSYRKVGRKGGACWSRRMVAARRERLEFQREYRGTL